MKEKRQKRINPVAILTPAEKPVITRRIELIMSIVSMVSSSMVIKLKCLRYR